MWAGTFGKSEFLLYSRIMYVNYVLGPHILEPVLLLERFAE
ncbi:hypothetical protein SAMN05421739_101717 [Pontibacter chinhatensis]|uniref:Uncharacterized protein n=1 Tax=Pontibacter chinhatensis TaxID=1436961 RepID=A0A1I2NG80_9BACT|nr:hypothetical protein SAMN05421739_101717 [Pontibacter chinhatensis]